MIYLNHATTTWPKPETVYRAVDGALRSICVPHRGSTPGEEQGSTLLGECRREVASFLGISDAARLVFTPGCTWALNHAVQGLPWCDGDVALMSAFEHHAVSRPLRKVARERGIRFEVVAGRPGRPIDLEQLEALLRRGRVRLVACMMASNVTGEILPVKEVVGLAHRYGALALVDAAQTAGVFPVDVGAIGCDLLAVPGHKGLLGPPGVGCLYVAPQVRLGTFAEGGTGKDSGKHAVSGELPACFEVGTHNLPAIAGLAAGVRWLRETGLEQVHRREGQLTREFLEGIGRIRGARVHGPPSAEDRVAVVSVTLAGTKPKAVAEWLATDCDVTTRAGYHCAPLAHETLGTLPGDGTLRLSFGWSNSQEEVRTVLEHLACAPRTVG
jgi:cysteine desulfurase family protein